MDSGSSVWRRRLIVATMLALSLGAQPRSAHALDRDVRAVLIAGLYGIAGGTILGAASLPLTREPRTVFMGSSLGLYLGIAVGFYYIWHRYDPGNPLHMDPEPPPPWQRPKSHLTPTTAREQPLFEARFKLLEF